MLNQTDIKVNVEIILILIFKIKTTTSSREVGIITVFLSIKISRRGKPKIVLDTLGSQVHTSDLIYNFSLVLANWYTS